MIRTQNPASPLRAWAVPALLVAASMLLLSGCMLSAVLPAAGWLSIAIGLALGVAACSSSSSGGGNGNEDAVEEAGILTIKDATAYENAGNVTFALTLSNPISNELTVSYATADGTAVAGTHYQQSAGTIAFPPNDTSTQSIVVPTIDNSVFNIARDFTLTISDPTAEGATLSIDVATATGKIRNDEATLNLGTADATELGAIRKFNGAAAGEMAGTALAGGDMNNDGLTDIVIGSPSGTSGKGFVVYGSATLGATTNLGSLATPGAGFNLTNPTSLAGLGTSVAAVGDLDDDGKEDLLIGAPGRSITFDGLTTATGVAVFLLGSNSAIASGSVVADYLGGGDAEIVNRVNGAFAGKAVSAAGDMNGDGTPDLLIGDSRASRAQVISGAGVLSDSSIDVNTAFNGLRISDAVASLGGAVAGDCDVNGDSYPDIIVGQLTGNGLTRVIFGGPAVLGSGPNTLAVSIPSTSQFVTFTGANAGDNAGTSVACGGDINGDGFDEVIIGAPQYGTPDYGAVYVVYGTGSPTDVSLGSLNGTNGFRINVSTELNPDPGLYFGVSVAGGKDLNADGVPDIVAVTGSTFVVSAFVIFGDADGMGVGGVFQLHPVQSQRVARLDGQDGASDDDVLALAFRLAWRSPEM